MSGSSESKKIVDQSLMDFNSPELFINREISMLEFQKRVLEEALDPKNPLLERVKFLAILGLNLDEFFMVRVAGLKKQIDVGVVNLPPDGMTATEQLAAIRKVALQLMVKSRDCLHQDLIPALKNNGVYLLDYHELNDRQVAAVKTYFDEVIFPVLTPLAFDPGHPFPHISNLSLNLAVLLKDKQGREHFARVKIPNTIPRFIPIKRSSGGHRKDGTIPHNHYFVWLEQVIAVYLGNLFPGMQIIQVHPFRVTRDADLEIQELEAADLLETMEQSVRQRRFGSVVRLTINEAMPAFIRNILVENLDVDINDIYVVNSPLGLSGLMSLYALDRFDLKDTPHKPMVPAIFNSDGSELDFFSLIRKQDILLHHPYDSFLPVVDFLNIAAYDPDVLAIKQTLYRVGKNPPIVDALLEAAQNGKQVAVLVELKARFDEESNIVWAKKLEKEGVHVVYGLLGLKTHSKIALVVRKEGEMIRRYVHLSTGNYNATTAQLYEDIGMFTCDDEIGADVTDLFNYLTGYSSKEHYRKLLVAPINLRERLEWLIHREINHKQNGNIGHMILKINSLVDKKMIQLLYYASQNGVRIDLFVRGICCLRPGVPGISENIQVTSIVGRFLEHSRIFYFHNGGDEEIFLGSADLMPRNIDRRVEVLFPVMDKKLITYIKENILNMYLNDNVRARKMLADSTYARVKPGGKEKLLDIQDWLLRQRGDY